MTARRAAFAAVLGTFLWTPAVAADLTVVVDGVRGGKGQVMVALFDSAEGFERDRRIAGAFVTARAGRVYFAFPNLAPGSYAVSTFHDEDQDGELDTGLLGIPSEGYGFSNDVTGFAGPPSFAAATITVESTDAAVTVKLSY